MSLNIAIKILPNAKDLPLPSYATAASAGMDLMAAIDQDIILTPGAWQVLPTGIALAMPNNYEAQIRPRSGLAAKNGITVLNTPGTIDADYRGEIGVILINLSKQDFTITRSMRIAQMVFAEVAKIEFTQVEELPATTRGEGGFGSTGS